MMYECKIAEKLVALRTAKGVTQEDVASDLSVSNKTISKWENGASAPDLPMLVQLARYYGVTTDFLLGLAEAGKKSTHETVQDEFQGLGRKEAICKAFELARSVIPAVFKTVSFQRDNDSTEADAFPDHHASFYRSQISTQDFFNFTASSEDINLAVMLLRNERNFAWMTDPDKQQKIVKLFKFLSSEDTLSVLSFIHSDDCSTSFTADHIAAKTGLDEHRTTQILDDFCDVGDCLSVTAQLAEGEVTVYECYGDGILLTVIALAFEKMCGRNAYEYNFSGTCKMIGGAQI